jgi:hypothetical protein
MLNVGLVSAFTQLNLPFILQTTIFNAYDQFQHLRPA